MQILLTFRKQSWLYVNITTFFINSDGNVKEVSAVSAPLEEAHFSLYQQFIFTVNRT